MRQAAVHGETQVYREAENMGGRGRRSDCYLIEDFCCGAAGDDDGDDAVLPRTSDGRLLASAPPSPTYFTTAPIALPLLSLSPVTCDVCDDV